MYIWFWNILHIWNANKLWSVEMYTSCGEKPAEVNKHCAQLLEQLSVSKKRGWRQPAFGGVLVASCALPRSMSAPWWRRRRRCIYERRAHSRFVIVVVGGRGWRRRGTSRRRCEWDCARGFLNAWSPPFSKHPPHVTGRVPGAPNSNSKSPLTKL